MPLSSSWTNVDTTDAGAVVLPTPAGAALRALRGENLGGIQEPFKMPVKKIWHSKQESAKAPFLSVISVLVTEIHSVPPSARVRRRERHRG
jgi:hypothetical protein